MPDTVICRACGHEFEPASLSTDSGACPECKFDPKQFANQLWASFEGPFTPPAPTLFYRVGILLVAAMMLLLPLVYVGLITGVMYLEYKHATQWGLALLSGNSGSGGRRQGSVFLLFYLGPLLAGGILIVFMLKPLLAARPKSQEAQVLDPAEEPLLFEFVARLCDKIGSVRPVQIRIDAMVNASASFRQGWLGLLGNQLVLTIGAPLAAGLNLRQFTGVLAHEFGHFAQGTGMRLTYVIRSVNAWFARVVYERDAWDERLVQWGQHMPLRELQVILWVSRFFVWLTRRILWVLMYLGHAISCFMLRQMEFNADLYEARMVGSDTFQATAERLQLLNLGWHASIYDLQRLWADEQLPDDVCQLLLLNVTQFTPDVADTLRAELASQKTGWFDTHPCDADRIKSACRDQAPGLFQVEGWTARLFQDFSSLARQISVAFYRESLGEKFQPSGLVPVGLVLARQIRDREEIAARDRYFGGALNALRLWDFSGSEAVERLDLPTAARRLAELRAAAERESPAYHELFKQYDEADTRWLEAQQAIALLRGGLRVKPADFHLAKSDLKAAAAADQSAVEQMQQLSGPLSSFEELTRERLAIAVSLLDDPEIAARLPGAGSWQTETRVLQSISGELARVWQRVLQLRNSHSGLALLLQNFNGNGSPNTMRTAIQSALQTVAGQLSELHQALACTRYPFEHGVKDVSVAHYALDRLPEPDNVGQIYEAGTALPNQLNLLAARLSCRLAYIALAIEAAVVACTDPVAEAVTEPPSENGEATTTPDRSATT
ncbi:MAG: M48 family metalloprotease [Planctomycetaceae bacterium]|nr:M48 family metalloprotease [Planctomycetaceae bacterium]